MVCCARACALLWTYGMLLTFTVGFFLSSVSRASASVCLLPMSHLMQYMSTTWGVVRGSTPWSWDWCHVGSYSFTKPISEVLNIWHHLTSLLSHNMALSNSYFIHNVEARWGFSACSDLFLLGHVLTKLKLRKLSPMAVNSSWNYYSKKNWFDNRLMAFLMSYVIVNRIYLAFRLCWTKQAIWKCHTGFWEITVGLFHLFSDISSTKWLSVNWEHDQQIHW